MAEPVETVPKTSLIEQFSLFGKQLSEILMKAVDLFDAVYALSPAVAIIVVVVTFYGILQILKIPFQIISALTLFFSRCFRFFRWHLVSARRKRSAQDNRDDAG